MASLLMNIRHIKCGTLALSYSCCTKVIGPSYVKLVNPLISCTSFHTSIVDDAARKGTRARRDAIKAAAKKKKLAQEAQKPVVPFSARDKKAPTNPRIDYSHRLPIPTDDVFNSKLFQWPVHTVAEAVIKHRETHHPTQYNIPNAPLYLSLELDLATDKKNRFLDHIEGVVTMPHPFPTGQERQVAVLTDCLETQARAQEIGVHMVGGREVVKLVLNGTVNMSKYDYVVSSLDILMDLVPIRGILRKKFPSPREGTAMADVITAANRFLCGLKYEAERDNAFLDYATVDVVIGTLEMPADELDANVTALMEDIRRQRSKGKSSDLITKAYLRSPPTKERFLLDLTKVAVKEKPSETAATSDPKPKQEETLVSLAN